jgi:molybdenum cofactor cytidylyltransferase
MIVAVILSAGESSRMGSPKCLLPVDGETFVERIVSVLKKTKVGKVIVVLGHRGEEIKDKIKHLPVTILINEDYRKGQLSSLQTAVKTLSGEQCEGILVHLVDHPFLSASLVDLMIERFHESKKLIVVPSYKGRRGHPVLFSSRLFPEVLAAPLAQGAREVVHAHRADTLEMETQDAGVTVDIDTPEEYQRSIGRS